MAVILYIPDSGKKWWNDLVPGIGKALTSLSLFLLRSTSVLGMKKKVTELLRTELWQKSKSL